MWGKHSQSTISKRISTGRVSMVDVRADIHQGRVGFKVGKETIPSNGLLFHRTASSREEDCGGFSQTDVTCACPFLYDSVYSNIVVKKLVANVNAIFLPFMNQNS